MATRTCRLRKHRKSAQLSQREVAFLIGLKSQGTIADIEVGRKRASLAVAVACDLVFGVSVHDLFPGLSGEVRRALLERIARLHVQLQSQKRRSAARGYLAALIARMGGSHI